MLGSCLSDKVEPREEEQRETQQREVKDSKVEQPEVSFAPLLIQTCYLQGPFLPEDAEKLYRDCGVRNWAEFAEKWCAGEE